MITTNFFILTRQIESQKGSKAKKQLLAKLDDTGKKLFHLAYNNFLQFKMTLKTKSFDFVNQIDEPSDADLEAYIDKLNEIASMKSIDSFVKKNVIDLINKFNPEDAELLIRVLNKDMLVGCSATSLLAVFGPKFLPTYEVPLCEKISEVDNLDKDIHRIVEYPGLILAQPKLDGQRVTYIYNRADDSIECLSRNGKPIYTNNAKIDNSVQILIDELKTIHENTTALSDYTHINIDGEIVSKTFDDLMSTNRRANGSRSNSNTFKVWTYWIQRDTALGTCGELTRYSVLKDIVDKVSNYIEFESCELVENTYIAEKDPEKLKQVLVTLMYSKVKEGYEGIVIKNALAPISLERGWNWVKMKPVFDADLTVVDLYEGEDSAVGTLGGLVLEGLIDGVQVQCKVGSGFTDDVRSQLWNNPNEVIGKTVEIQYQEKTKDNSLRFPVFIKIRDDK